MTGTTPSPGAPCLVLFVISGENRAQSLKERNSCCAALFESQYGVLHRRQALECGISESGIKTRLNSGLWAPILPSVYRLSGSQRSWQQNVIAAQLWAGPASAVSHRAAAALWQLDGNPAGLVEVTVPRMINRPMHWITVHTSKRLGLDDITVHHGIAVTTVARTLLDLGAVQRKWRIQAALDHARRKGLVSDQLLLAELERLGGRGSRGIGVIRPMLAELHAGVPPAGNVLERLLIGPLKERGAPDPVRQYRLHDEEGVVGDFDLAWPAVKLGIEGDGFDPHMTRYAFHADRRKMNRAARLGWTVLRATWEDARRPTAFVETVLSFFL